MRSRWACLSRGVIAATMVGVAVATVVHRSGVIEPDSIELMPDASAPAFDEAAARASRRRRATYRGAGSVDDKGLEEALAGLAATGIRPTFAVEAEVAREIAAEPPCEQAREPALSASRA